MEITIGKHQIILKDELQRKDIIPLGKIDKLKQRFGDITHEEFIAEIEKDMEVFIEFTDLLIRIWVISIDGEEDTDKIIKAVNSFSFEDSNELMLKII